jgi:hypothetical protein
MSYAEYTNRQKKICLLREKAQHNYDALQLFHRIEQNCGILLDVPNDAPEALIRKYNKLVNSSDLSLPERKELLM